MSPILNPSPFLGVCVTPSQSRPPMIGFPANSGNASCSSDTSAQHNGPTSLEVCPPVSCFRQHDPNGCSHQHFAPRQVACKYILMRVDNGRQIDLPCADLLLQYRRNSEWAISLFSWNPGLLARTHSSGFAGSMITASFVLSSTTRYA